MHTSYRILGVAALLASGASAAALKSYNVDPSTVSVSGLSAGGFMAAQLGVAYSDLFATGFGVFAGGPFDCARSQTYSMCINNNNPSITAPTNNMRTWSGKSIAPVSNLKNRKIYLEVGTSDTTVGPNPMNALKTQLANFDDQSKVSFVSRSGQAHTFPTDFDGTGDNACGSTLSPYISNCGYDGAGAVLKWMYGTLKARNNGAATGTVVSFDQTGQYGSMGLDTTAYLYVPKACQSGSTVCKLHVSLHGCQQNYGSIQNKYIQNTGYNKWADTNNIIILYPQTVADYTTHQTPGSGSVPNGNACFDWIGWYGSTYDQKSGTQMTALTNQVKQIIKGYKGGNGGTTMTTTTSSPATSPASESPSASPTSGGSVTCAYYGQYVKCPNSSLYQFCYYVGQTYTC